MRPPFPFFVGCPRSGTTLVRSLFDAHPDVAIPVESHFTVWLRRQLKSRTRQVFAPEPFLDELLNNSWVSRWGVSLDDFRTATRYQRDAAGVLRSIYAQYAVLHGKPRYADKTPDYVLDMDLLAELFPEAVFVHVIRDGRNVALSLSEVDWPWAPSSVDTAARYWRMMVSAGRRAGADLGPGRYREIRYEDVVADTEVIIRSLCPFIQVDFDPAMLSYHLRASEVLTGLPNPEDHRLLAQRPMVGVRDWRRDMSSADADVFWRLASKLLIDLGYESSPRVQSFTTWSRASRARVRHVLGRARARSPEIVRRLTRERRVG